MFHGSDLSVDPDYDPDVVFEWMAAHDLHVASPLIPGSVWKCMNTPLEQRVPTSGLPLGSYWGRIVDFIEIGQVTFFDRAGWACWWAMLDTAVNTIGFGYDVRGDCGSDVMGGGERRCSSDGCRFSFLSLSNVPHAGVLLQPLSHADGRDRQRGCAAQRACLRKGSVIFSGQLMRFFLPPLLPFFAEQVGNVHATQHPDEAMAQERAWKAAREVRAREVRTSLRALL